MKKILIDIYHNKEVRIIWIKNNIINNLKINKLNQNHRKYNIYKGTVDNINFGLEVIFVNYSFKKCGILPFSKIFNKNIINKNNKKYFYVNKKILKKNSVIIVQIIREEHLNKKAILTNIITLSGNYLILLINSKNLTTTIKFSKKINFKNIFFLKKIIKKLNIPKKMSLIVRFSSINRSFKELKNDFLNLLKKKKKIKNLTKNNIMLNTCKKNIFKECLQYCLKNNFKKIVINYKELYIFLHKKLLFLKRLDILEKIKIFNNTINLLKFYDLNTEFKSIFTKKVILPSGGNIFFDITEAIIVIDVNSSKCISKKNFESTALYTNLEAAYKISQQIKLRNLGGIIIIDFINMKYLISKKFLEISIKKFFKNDYSRIKLGKISKFGLFEFSRQKF
ncbi:ribonuclease E/G [Buchnera aphidicola]|uniref:ribonuclease E/G n=1 Tax=Buchnera aphidicola TaxID=9 RepID=UPI0034641D93